MAICCQTPIDSISDNRTLTVALAGNPNSGKTTLFTALTGLRQKVGNYPGVTVEKKTGRAKLSDGKWIDIIDLPGTYSLISRSPDEQVAMEVLRGLRPGTKSPDVVVVVVDASNLQRNLYLVSQVIELGRPLVIALNMMDIAHRRGIRVSPEILSQELGVPVAPVVGYRRKGIAELKAAILKAAVAPMPDWPLPQAMKEELLIVGGGLAILDSGEEGTKGREEGTKARRHEGTKGNEEKCRLQNANCKSQIDSPTQSSVLPSGLSLRVEDSPQSSPQHSALSTQHLGADAIGENFTPSAPRAWICGGDRDRRLDRYEALAERLLIGDRAADLDRISKQEPVASLLNAATGRLRALGIDPMQADVEAHYQWIETVA